MNNGKKWCMLTTATLGLLGAMTSIAQADLIGATVDVTANYPTSTTIFKDPGNKVVTNAIEYPVGSYITYNSDFQVDVTGTQLILTNTGFNTIFANASFNGLVLKVVSGPTILSASADSSGSFSPISVTVLNGNEIDINYAGVSAAQAGTSIVNIQTVPASTPEPGSIALLIGMSVTGAGILARRRRANKVA